jgi:DNA-binding PadR family transcriptional regulator
LYPALYRLEDQGLLTTEWGISENNRRAKYYELTRAGNQRLKEEKQNWSRAAAAMAAVLAAD